MVAWLLCVIAANLWCCVKIFPLAVPVKFIFILGYQMTFLVLADKQMYNVMLR